MADTKGGSRRGSEGWELRAAVTEASYDFLVEQALRLGRAQRWHVGVAVEAFAAVAKQLQPREQSALDDLLRDPDRLLELLRPGLR
jgi:hypothetical protein